MKISPTKNRHGTSKVVFYLLLNLELIRILNENHYIIHEWPYYQMLLNSEIGITELKSRPKVRRLMNSKIQFFCWSSFSQEEKHGVEFCHNDPESPCLQNMGRRDYQFYQFEI